MNAKITIDGSTGKVWFDRDVPVTLLARRRDLETIRRGILAELKSLKAGDDPAAADPTAPIGDR